jgi:hypothetical protein
MIRSVFTGVVRQLGSLAAFAAPVVAAEFAFFTSLRRLRGTVLAAPAGDRAVGIGRVDGVRMRRKQPGRRHKPEIPLPMTAIRN